VLPLVPVYIGYLSGTAAAGGSGSRLWTVGNAGAFVAGFTVVFVLLGSLAGLTGALLSAEGAPLAFLGRLAASLHQATPWLARIGGLVLIVLGLHLAGLVRIPLLYRELRLQHSRPRRTGLIASAVVGMAFAAGWTPCVGPYLMAILLLAGDAGTAARGALLLGVYSLGLGLPFLLAALALQAVSARLRRLNRYLDAVSLVGGSLLIAMGLLLALDRFHWLSALLGSLWQPPIMSP
jgi:cytochrome c-type biogenesis protein